MAQQFVLKGVKELRDYSSTDGTFSFMVKQDPRGGDTWQIPQWWAKKANNMQYQSCTVLEIKDTNYLLVIPTSMDTQLMVTYDGDIYQLKFTNFNAVERIAVTDRSTKKIVLEYLLPSISGGAVAKRILQKNNEIGEFTITGKAKIDVPGTSSYQSNATVPETMQDVTYAWTLEEDGSTPATSKAEITDGDDKPACTVSWKQDGTYDLTCTITSPNAQDSGANDTKTVVATTPATVGKAEIIGSTVPQAKQATQYQTLMTGSTVASDTLKYNWGVEGGSAFIANTPDDSVVNITFDVAGNYKVKCTVTSDPASDSDSTELSVDASIAKEIGVVDIDGNAAPNAATATNYQCTDDGTVADQTYAWTYVPNDGTVQFSSTIAQSPNITFNKAQGYELTCEVSSATANNSPQSATFDVDVQALAGQPGVTLGGSQNITNLTVFNPYTSNTTDGSTLAGVTTYQWTAEDSSGDKSASNGAVFSTDAGKTATDQNTEIKFTKDGETYAVRCKWTNEAYTDPTKTGMRNVSVDQPDIGSVSITPAGPLDLTTGVASQTLTAQASGSAPIDSWAWTSNAEAKVSFGTPTSASTTVTCSEDGTFTITATATSANATPSTSSISKNVSATTP